MSCSRPPIASSRSRAGGRPSSSPTCTASSATRRVWASVYSSFAARRRSVSADLRPEVRLLGRTSSAPRRSPVSGRDGARAEEVDRDDAPTSSDARDLEAVAEPPAELEVV